MSEIPDDIDRIATDLVRARYEDDWGMYVAVAQAILSERQRRADTISRLLQLATHSSTCGHRFGHDCDCGLQYLRTANGDSR